MKFIRCTGGQDKKSFRRNGIRTSLLQYDTESTVHRDVFL